MGFLENIIDTKTIKELEDKYDKDIIANIIIRQEEVLKIIEYFNSIGLNVKTILINRLDIFLFDLEYIKKKIDNNQEVIEDLKSDFSIFDELV